MSKKPGLISLSAIFLLIIFFLPQVQPRASGSVEEGSRELSGDESRYPFHPGYSRLQKALLKYRETASLGGWPEVRKGAPLKEGDKAARVMELKKRLVLTGDLSVEETGSEDVFDGKLRHAVIRFQERHGLKQDGVAGKETINSLNVPVQERIRQIEINMERLKLTPNDLERRIIVNIAAFELEVVEAEETVMTMKVIVGKPYWYTPLFGSAMTHLVFNPSWYVPRSIAVRELLPKIRKDPDYLIREGFKVFSNNLEVDIFSVDWGKVGPDNFPYRFVQAPGLLNPLGKIKFTFPNEFNVYLHDTPARVLFEKSSRAFSHGCIRIEKPVELAEYLLRDDPAWTHEKILSEIDKGKEMKVRLPSPVDIQIVYLTAWVNKDNLLQFRNDVYGRDIRP